ncbi:MAG: zinc-binding alcohol dehydrogenase [Armatimonadetes bacterium]|nr:zinc-binding alcohol dehydrogenase [Armatimonadota bacterium]
MSNTRRVLCIDGSGVILVREEPIPEVKSGQVLIEVKASLISPGTELGGVKGRRANPNPEAEPWPFGYSNAGNVLARGEGCEDIPVGARLACLGGGYALHATHAVVPRNLTEPIPDGVTYEEAASVMLSTTALHAIRRGEVSVCENVLVIGLGVVGQFCVQWARLGGAHVVAWDRYPLRLQVAKKVGAELVVNVAAEDPVAATESFTRGYGVDCAIMAFGGDGNEAFRQILQCMKLAPDTHYMGNVVVVGGASLNQTLAAAVGNIDVRSSARPGPGYHDEAWEHGQSYPPVFVPWTTKRNMEESLRLTAEGRLDVDSLITDRVSLNDAPAACDKLIDHPDQALGVVVLP